MLQWKPVWPSCEHGWTVSANCGNTNGFGDEPQHRPGNNLRRRRRMFTLNSWCHSGWLCWAPADLPLCFSGRDKIVSGPWPPSHEGWCAPRDTARIASSASPTKPGLDWIAFKTSGKLWYVWTYGNFWSDNDEGTYWGQDNVAQCDFNFWGAWEKRT